MNRIPGWRLYLALAWVFSIPPVAGAASHRPLKNSKLQVTDVESNLVIGEYNYRVVRVSQDGGIDEKFQPVICQAGYVKGEQGGKNNDGKCYPVLLSDGSFLLVDCWAHDSVAHDCQLLKFDYDGTPDKSFDCPFVPPEGAIKSIKEVTALPGGIIRVKGSFISPSIDWTLQQAASEEDDEVGKDGIVLLGKSGKLKSFSTYEK